MAVANRQFNCCFFLNQRWGQRPSTRQVFFSGQTSTSNMYVYMYIFIYSYLYIYTLYIYYTIHVYVLYVWYYDIRYLYLPAFLTVTLDPPTIHQFGANLTGRSSNATTPATSHHDYIQNKGTKHIKTLSTLW